MIANALADELVRQGVVGPAADWAERRDRRFREHLASLDDLYFAKGQERLERLRLRTQGKADGVRSTDGSAGPPWRRAPDDRSPLSEHRATDSP